MEEGKADTLILCSQIPHCWKRAVRANQAPVKEYQPRTEMQKELIQNNQYTEPLLRKQAFQAQGEKPTTWELQSELNQTLDTKTFLYYATLSLNCALKILLGG